MRPIKLQLIECPNCGAQYLPGEIYLPEHFLGKPTNILRDSNGKLIDFDGTSQDLYEEYQCDYCDKLFNVKCDISYRSSIDPRTDFDEDYVTQIKTGMILDEN